MTTLIVRDHSEPCEHGYEEPHEEIYKGHVGRCLGGKEIVLSELLDPATKEPVKGLYVDVAVAYPAGFADA